MTDTTRPRITRETLTCGCCRGPWDNRCACWIHRFTTPIANRLTLTYDGRRVAHMCTDCAVTSPEDRERRQLAIPRHDVPTGRVHAFGTGYPTIDEVL